MTHGWRDNPVDVYGRPVFADKAGTAAAKLSIVVVPRERFSYSKVALDSLFAQQTPFRLIYIDNRSPPAISKWLRHQSVMRNFELVRLDDYVSPNHARNIGLTHASSEYVLFIDNDCELSSGALAALVKCADETGATAVAPVYFERDYKGERLHMAGARVAIFEHLGIRDYTAEHCVKAPTERRETDLFEFHCVLLRRVGLEPLDPMLLSALEQEDLALEIQTTGGSIWIEPAARVTYVLGPIDRYDAAYVRLRWCEPWNRVSVDHFAKKWDLKPGWGEDTFDWCNDHRRRVLALERKWWQR